MVTSFLEHGANPRLRVGKSMTCAGSCDLLLGIAGRMGFASAMLCGVCVCGVE